MDDDPWIKARSRLISAERLHALGAVTFYWNSCESSLFYLFCRVYDLEEAVARLLVHDLQLPAIGERITNLTLHTTKVDAAAKEHVLHAVQLFDANRVNRNQLTHFWPVMLVGQGLEFVRVKGPVEGNTDVIPTKLEDLRRVADDFRRLIRYVAELTEYLDQKSSISAVPLPDKPALPERLWKPPAPPQTQSRKRRQPQH